MTLIDRMKMLWKQRSRYAGSRALTIGEDCETLAQAVEERFAALEARMRQIEAAATRYDPE